MDAGLYILLSLIVLWLLYKQFVPVKGLRTLAPEQFQSESKGNKVIDVREIHEYKRGHIKGAVNVPLSQLQQRLGDIPKDRTIYLYCQSGMRSKQAAKLLGRNGYADVAHLRGGMMAWSGPTQK
ncbi:rhodanese-like domain-containing protein [Paenibacillus antri]|uniref:Rhodanese-like domain-containing protein n=1 Tax=Paenibacillus antri TaxID=2582848 RepID=A0A5R9GCK2_9BACL|nr:rhodanese-like domain-containing protein [Paenibacillus antri]TLS52819.1 rhodanese-like domain-containing protein [Paenibacillus antri]